MRGKHKFIFTLLLAISVGCQSAKKEKISFKGAPAPALSDHIYQSLVPEHAVSNVELSEQRFDAGPLNDFNFSDPGNFMRYTLDQCIENALQNSEVVRELGGTILRSPELMRTDKDPALAYTNPRTGEEAALSAFDANFGNQFSFQSNDRGFNSSFVGNQGIFQQKLANNTTRLSKRSATGGQFQLIHQVLYDMNNTQANRFTNDTAYDTFLGGEFRQPLLQGGGVDFNRIAGPNNLPGVNNGVLIARTNTDITLANFEIGIRNLVSEVENAYWDLYFAYRDLEAKIEARNGAYEIWKSLEADSGNKKRTEILQAEEQYYLFAARVKDAIHGQLNDGTRINNGSSGGTFRGNSGVRTAERRLRLIAGYPVNEGLLIVPQDTPVEAQVVFDWEQVKTDALSMRTELRRQRWVMKREELGLIANKNHLLPSLDVVGKYRMRGFGNDLFGRTAFDPSIPFGVSAQDNSSATATFLGGDLQEWELGMDLNIPLGYRRQMAAVRNSELALMREKKILREQEREIIYGLSNALGEVERTSSLMQANTQRLHASQEQYKAIQEDYLNDDTTIDLVLESQRRVIDAKLDYFRTQVEFMLAVKAVHFEKGTVLHYHNVAMSEGGWSGEEYRQALDRERRKSAPLNYIFNGRQVSSAINQVSIGYTETSPVMLGSNEVNSSSASGLASDKPSADDKRAAKIAKKEAEHASVLVELAKKLDEKNDPVAKMGRLVGFKGDGDSSEANSNEGSQVETLTTAKPTSLLSRLHSKAKQSLAPSNATQATSDSVFAPESSGSHELISDQPQSGNLQYSIPSSPQMQNSEQSMPFPQPGRMLTPNTNSGTSPLSTLRGTQTNASSAGSQKIIVDPWSPPQAKFSDFNSNRVENLSDVSGRRQSHSSAPQSSAPNPSVSKLTDEVQPPAKQSSGQLKPLKPIQESLNDSTVNPLANAVPRSNPISVSLGAPAKNSASLGKEMVEPSPLAAVNFRLSDLPK